VESVPTGPTVTVEMSVPVPVPVMVTVVYGPVKVLEPDVTEPEEPGPDVAAGGVWI
jgi:hypothetical protein